MKMKELGVRKLIGIGILAAMGACQRPPSPEPQETTRAPLSASLDLGATGSIGLAGTTINVGGNLTVTIELSTARVVAVGIPGASAVTQIGTFQLGGPFHDNATFAASTAPGQILDGNRLLVAAASNFGQPMGRVDQAPGALLSIDPTGHGLLGGPMTIGSNFASGGGQASTAGGHVTLYAANNLAFSNSLFSPSAATAPEVAVSLPLGISLNNAFGRPWIANAPNGNTGYGTVSVLDPNGAPFKGPPDPVAGGVFAGNVTNRSPASTHGLSSATVATALLTKSPDGSGRAVFLAAQADGSVVQVHVQLGVDGLAPPGSFTPLTAITLPKVRSILADDITRVGMVFNWVPNRTVFVSDPIANRILVLDLGSNGTVFTESLSYLTPAGLDRPVDLAPTSVETAARNFASNTTLGAGSDIYVLNRGNNTVLRMTQQGVVVAARQVGSSLTGIRLAGLGVSPDGRTIWLTATTPGDDGALLAIDAFGAGSVTPSLFAQAQQAGANGEVAQGGFVFSHTFSTGQSLGPLFNASSCVTCHNTPALGGAGTSPGSFVTRFGQTVSGSYDPMSAQGGPVARAHSVAELGISCGLATGVPAAATVRSPRSAMTLRGSALIDTILDAPILAGQAAQPIEVRGRANVLSDGRLGKFGWKAAVPTLVEFMADALRDEMGLTNPVRPTDLVNDCGANASGAEVDAVPLTSLVAFLNTLDPATPTPSCLGSSGAVLFASTGCASCHTPSLPGPGTPTAAQKPVRLYSDLLLHDLGPALADGVQQAGALGTEFRTTPLWGLSDRRQFLHDGRAATVQAAIAAHGGQGAAASAAFGALSPSDQQALLAFLGCI
jgi:hypothetical protein